MEQIKDGPVLIPCHKKFTLYDESWTMDLREMYGDFGQPFPPVRVRHFIKARKWKVCNFFGDP